MARRSYDKSKLIQILETTPLVNYACKKVGVGRTTFYRWMKDNLDFRREVERALEAGRSQWNEVAESSLMKNVKDAKMDAIKFFLVNNDPRYRPKHASPSGGDMGNAPRKGSSKDDAVNPRALAPLPPDLRERRDKLFRENGLLDALPGDAAVNGVDLEEEVATELEEERAAEAEERRQEEEAVKRDEEARKKLEDAINIVDQDAINKGYKTSWPPILDMVPMEERIRGYRRTFGMGEEAQGWDFWWEQNKGRKGPPFPL